MRPPIALSIAGSDPSGGAGFQADLKTMTALGVYGTAVVTALTAQNTQGLRDVFPVDDAVVRAQVLSVLEDIPVDATKIGMLPSSPTAAAIATLVAEHRRSLGFVVVDPLIVTGAGDPLMTQETLRILVQGLLPHADIVTPNIAGAAMLLGTGMATDEDEMEQQARRLLELGPKAVLLKGGHLRGSESVDLFVTADHSELLRGRRVRTRNTHGTASTLSSAIAAQYARIVATGGGDVSVGAIVASARDYLAAAIETAADWEISFTPETGHGPVNHLVTLSR